MAVSEIDLGDVLANDDVWLGPDSYTLNQNYPNPFNPSTDISFDAGVSGEVSLVIYDILGNKVRTLVSGFVTPGNYVVSWDGTDNNGNNVSSGVYVYTLISQFLFKDIYKGNNVNIFLCKPVSLIHHKITIIMTINCHWHRFTANCFEFFEHRL